MEGELSVSSPVESGVPQGSVLGPILFLIFINDLPDVISPKSTARLFADDCVLYRKINTSADSESLQQDLDNLQKWEKNWQMEFHPEKCQVMHITTKRRPIITPYNIHGHILEQTDTGKYLGVNISNNMNWNKHIDQVTRKATNVNNFLHRNIRQFPRKTKEQCYFTLVRPIMEYACTVWDPHTSSNIKKLEAVQRRAARFVYGDYRTTSSVTTMLKQLQWSSLQERRNQCKLLMMYRIVYNLVDIPSDQLTPQTTTIRGHTLRYRIPYARTLVYQ